MRQLSLLDLDVDASASPGAARSVVATTAGGPRDVSTPQAIVLDPPSHDAARSALEKRLELASGGRVALTLTDNRRTMLSVRRREGVRHVRLHQMFLHASP